MQLEILIPAPQSVTLQNVHRIVTTRHQIILARRQPGVSLHHEMQPEALRLLLSVIVSPVVMSIVVVQLPSLTSHHRITGQSQATITHGQIRAPLLHRKQTGIAIPALQGALIPGRIKPIALLQGVVIQGLTAHHREVAGVSQHHRAVAEALQHLHEVVM